MKLKPTAIASMLVASSVAHAGLISASNEPLSSTGAEVNPLSTVVAAWDVASDAASQVHNGITFSNTQPAQFSFTTPGGGDALNVANTEANYLAGSAIREIMGDFKFGPQNNTGGLFTASGLTVGQTYRIEFLSHQNVGSTVDRVMQIYFGSDTSGTSTGLYSVGQTVGGIATFDFEADATSQDFFFIRSGSSASRYILNGVILSMAPSINEMPRITAFSYNPADGSAEATIENAEPNTRFKLVESATLDFSNPDQDPVPLLGATVGTLTDGIFVITDENGVATVQFNLGTGPRNFVRAEQVGVITIASFDFEVDGQGFTPAGDWAWGTPASDNSETNGQVIGGNGGSTDAWATVLGDGGAPVNGGITPAMDSILRSPNIVLSGVTGASLRLAAAVDAAPGDTLEVLVRDAADDSLLGTITPFPTTFPANAAWQDLGPFALPQAAANKTIYLEFRFVGTDPEFLGFYLDDVKIFF